jgi:hypothetical protein
MTGDVLSTGLASLDNSIEAGGLRAESVVAVRSPARSVCRRLACNCCADRPVHYVALGGDADRYEPHVRSATGVGGEGVSTASLPLSTPGEALADHLDGLGAELPENATVVVDPTTPIEAVGEDAAAAALSALRSVVEATGGLAIALAVDVEGRQTPPGRWVTTSRADAVLSVTHRTMTDSVSHHLAVDRLPLGQRLRSEATRTFELPADLSMSLDASRTLSP